MHPLQWMFSLVDGISGPAKAITRSLRGVQGGMGSMASRAKSITSSIGDGFAKFGLIAQGVKAVGGAIDSIASGALDFGKFVVDSASFKRNTLAAFELMEGSTEKARETWDTVKAFSDRTPFETADVMEQFKQLRGAGYSTAAVQNVLSGVFDVAAMQGGKGKESAGRLVEAIAKLKGTDRADSEIFKQISEASGGGINLGDLYAAIGEGRKISKSAAQQLVSSGKIGGDEATKAILAVVQSKVDKGGPLGTAMEKFGAGSWEGQLSTLKSRFASLFEDVNIEPLIGVFRTVNDALSSTSETGQKLRAIFNAFTEKAGAGLAKIFSPENIVSALTFMADALDTVYGIVVAAWPYLEAIGGGIWDGLKEALGPVLKGFQEAFGSGDSSISNPKVVEGLRDLAIAAGWVLGKIAAVGAAFVKYGAYAVGAIAWITGYIDEFVGWFGDTAVPAIGSAISAVGGFFTGMWDGVSTFFGGLWDSFVAFGSDIVDGLWEGIKSTWRGLISKIEGLLDLLPWAAKKALGIASPSKVFAEIGRFTMEGFQVGIKDQAANTNNVVTRAIDVPSIVERAPATTQGTIAISSDAPSRRGGRDAPTIVVNSSVTINAPKDADEEKICGLVVRAMEDNLPGILEAHLADAAE